jgi:hypothetical protein
MSSHTLTLKMALRRFAAVLCMATMPHAQAIVSIQLERLSDTDALMFVSGQLDTAPPGGNAHSLALMDPFSARPGDTDNSWVLDSSDMRAGDYLFNFANQAGRCAANCPGTEVSPGVFSDNSGRANTIYFGNNDVVFPFPFPFLAIPSNTPITGSMQLQLQDGATFAPVGASGEVYWGTTALMLGKGVLVGSWEMVGLPAVPEPTAYAMLLAGLGLIGFVAHRRRLGSSSQPTRG